MYINYCYSMYKLVDKILIIFYINVIINYKFNLGEIMKKFSIVMLVLLCFLH